MFRRARGYFCPVPPRGATLAERLLSPAGDTGAMTTDATSSAASAARVRKPAPSQLLGQADLAVAAGLAVLAALVAFMVPAGSMVRAIVTLAILLVVPGYLLIEAAVTSVKHGQRGLHALVAIGVSPPFVALLALSTAAMPGGFHATPIILTVTVACLALAFVAAWRRLRSPVAAGAPVPTA
jgi:uncharacterized membrane protein